MSKRWEADDVLVAWSGRDGGLFHACVIEFEEGELAGPYGPPVSA